MANCQFTPSLEVHSIWCKATGAYFRPYFHPLIVIVGIYQWHRNHITKGHNQTILPTSSVNELTIRKRNRWLSCNQTSKIITFSLIIIGILHAIAINEKPPLHRAQCAYFSYFSFGLILKQNQIRLYLPIFVDSATATMWENKTQNWEMNNIFYNFSPIGSFLSLKYIYFFLLGACEFIVSMNETCERSNAMT